MHLVYWSHIIKHNGICSYKTFEGFTRKMSTNSLSNLNKRNYYSYFDEEKEQTILIDDVIKDSRVTQYCITPAISKKIKEACNKLHYYTANRKFTSKKSGTYNFKTAFITLTAPENYTPNEINNAFNGFLDYLGRTANCVYVYKKEVGFKSGLLHFHIMVNNFIPYYIISHKWRKLLIAQNPNFPTDNNGKYTNSHSRIELPRNPKQANSYISKYMSKGTEIWFKVGKLWGCSKLLKELKEIKFIEDELPLNLLERLSRFNKLLLTEYSSFICLNPLKLGKEFAEIKEEFLIQYTEFSQKISLPQRFQYV